METMNTNNESPSIEAITLKNGAHKRREQGVCLMEAVAWIAGEKHSDHPQCADRALAAYGRALNDRLKDDERQLLRPLIPKLVGTRGSLYLERKRAYLIVDRYMRHDLAAFMRELPHKPRPDLAERFEALPPVVDADSAARACDLAREVRADVWKNPPAAAAAAAAAYAADAAAAAYGAAAYAADAAAAALKALRQSTIRRAVATFEAAIALTEETPA